MNTSHALLVLTRLLTYGVAFLCLLMNYLCSSSVRSGGISSSCHYVIAAGLR